LFLFVVRAGKQSCKKKDQHEKWDSFHNSIGVILLKFGNIVSEKSGTGSYSYMAQVARGRRNPPPVLRIGIEIVLPALE